MRACSQMDARACTRDHSHASTSADRAASAGCTHWSAAEHHASARAAASACADSASVRARANEFRPGRILHGRAGVDELARTCKRRARQPSPLHGRADTQRERARAHARAPDTHTRAQWTCTLTRVLAHSTHLDIANTHTDTDPDRDAAIYTQAHMPRTCGEPTCRRSPNRQTCRP